MNREKKIIINSQIVDVKPVDGVVSLKHTIKSNGKGKVEHTAKSSRLKEDK